MLCEEEFEIFSTPLDRLSMEDANYRETRDLCVVDIQHRFSEGIIANDSVLPARGRLASINYSRLHLLQ